MTGKELLSVDPDNVLNLIARADHPSMRILANFEHLIAVGLLHGDLQVPSDSALIGEVDKRFHSTAGTKRTGLQVCGFSFPKKASARQIAAFKSLPSSTILNTVNSWWKDAVFFESTRGTASSEAESNLNELGWFKLVVTLDQERLLDNLFRHSLLVGKKDIPVISAKATESAKDAALFLASLINAIE